MPFALGRLVLITLGFFGPLRGIICAAGVTPAQPEKSQINGINSKSVSWDSPMDSDTSGVLVSFPDGFALTEATDSRPPQFGFRRPQLELQKRDGTCLANGTNFCFGDASSYCSSCGTCCSSSSNSISKWCCPSDGICCGSSCCASGQTCSNGQCYLPVETVTSTSLVATTATQVATKMVTVVLQVIEASITNPIVTITNTNAETQTNWQYVTVTSVVKRAEPTDNAMEDKSGYASSGALDGTAPIPGTASRTAAEELSAPTLSNELIWDLIKRQQAENSQNTLAASKSTTVVQAVITTTVIVSSTALTTTTVQTTSMVISTSARTITTVLNAKATVSAISTVTYTPRTPITRTLTKIATIPFSASLSPTASAATTTVAALQTGGPLVAKKGLATGAIAGIAVGVTIAALAAGLLALFCLRRHRRNKKVRQSISEDYAYLGTGRSESTGAPGINGTGSQGPVMQQAIRYSGPPRPNAVAVTGGRPISRQVTMQSDDHGLPPTPNFTRMPTKRSARSSTSAASASSPISATSQSSPFGSEAMQQNLGVAHSGSNGRKYHIRSSSALTNLTATSSTVVGGSARNSVQSTPAMAKATLAAAGVNGGQPHKRTSSSGGGSGVTVETLNEPAHGDSENSYDNAHGSTESSSSTPPPLLRPAEQPRTVPDPPSPYLEPRLGPLRIVNTPATPPTAPSIAEPDDLDLDVPVTPRSR